MGCAFHPRCTQAEAVCREITPPLLDSHGRLVACHFGGLKTLLAANELRKSYGSGESRLVALNGVSISVREGESVGVIGPSGSGKSTLARILTGHFAADEGGVTLDGEPLVISWRKQARQLRRRIQLVAQDPWDSLSPASPSRRS